nr:MAG TPA: hypothetical protein [Caudoviricetes sp.]
MPFLCISEFSHMVLSELVCLVIFCNFVPNTNTYYYGK